MRSPSADETIDELRDHGLTIRQSKSGYRFSVDPLLLSDFAQIRGVESVIDLGTGCGVIPLVLAGRGSDLRLVGVEFQPALAAQAAENVRENGLEERITIHCGDILDLRRHFRVSSFDLVLANPPYRRRGTGRVSPRTGRDDARHESTAGLADFLAMAKYLVKPSGRICFVHHPSRLAELMAAAAELKLAVLRLRMVHGTRQSEARIFLVELAKGRQGEMKVLPPLFTRDHDKERQVDNSGGDGVDLC